jgi:hypothetical protein
MIPSMMLAVATTVVHASLPSASLMMVMPEEVLSIGSIALMLVAAWGGQGSTRLISWAAVAVLVGAMIALLGPASSGGVALRHSPRY